MTAVPFLCGGDHTQRHIFSRQSFALLPQFFLIVLYLDDIRIEGEVPSKTDYQKEIKRRWAPYMEKVREKTVSMEKALEEARGKLDALTNLSETAEKMKTRYYNDKTRHSHKRCSFLKITVETENSYPQ